MKSRLCPAAELQGGHTPVGRVGLGHGNALKLDPLVCHCRFFSSSRQRRILPSQHHVLDFDSPRLLKLWRNCLHHLDLRCLMPALTPSTLCWVVGSAPWHAAVSCPSTYHVCLLATCYLLDKMTEPMQITEVLAFRILIRSWCYEECQLSGHSAFRQAFVFHIHISFQVCM